ncbi:MAG TPA: 4-(cytidine 5'-diphospho)-2-C-methyl-D-erythritol kinase [Usitatibacter sp.]|nr:4-(cytidine 5'-diphospho)-2-C-methyl-D-erythritol kinase [Usitatibacter sp.]
MQLPPPDYPAPAKLNLFLHVVGRRADGYHLLQSAFTLIDLSDTLRFRVRDDGAIHRVSDVAGVPATQDLVVRAALLLKEASGTALGADIEVEKRIPIGGGLGGGSSDAATTLLALNSTWKTGFDREALAEIGAGLGADVPFFIFGRNAWAEGIGDRLRALEMAPSWYVVLVPPVQVPTQAAYTAPELTRDTEALKMEDFSAFAAGFSLGKAQGGLHNDLESVVAARFPAVCEHLEWLRKHAKLARMTGSGCCVFAPFEDRDAAQRVIEALPASMHGFVAQGLGVHPLHAL